MSRASMGDTPMSGIVVSGTSDCGSCSQRCSICGPFGTSPAM